MKHQKFRNRVAYARRLGELEVENVAMELKIHRLARDNNRVVKKLHNLEEKHKDVLVELDMKTANFEKGAYDVLDVSTQGANFKATGVIVIYE